MTRSGFVDDDDVNDAEKITWAYLAKGSRFRLPIYN